MSNTIENPEKQSHDIKDAITSLKLLEELTRNGYQFNDESAAALKDKFACSVRLIDSYISNLL